MTTAIETKKDLKEALLHYLKYGEENATKKTVLADLCQVNERSMRLGIRELIDDGYPICGSPHPPYGYYIANSREEVTAELKLLRNGYGMELLRRYASLKRAGRSLLQPGQLTFKI